MLCLTQTVLDDSAEVVTRPNEPSNGSSELKLGPSRNFGATIEQPSNSTSSDLNIVLVSQVAQPSFGLASTTTIVNQVCDLLCYLHPPPCCCWVGFEEVMEGIGKWFSW